MERVETDVLINSAVRIHTEELKDLSRRDMKRGSSIKLIAPLSREGRHV